MSTTFFSSPTLPDPFDFAVMIMHGNHHIKRHTSLLYHPKVFERGLRLSFDLITSPSHAFSFLFSFFTFFLFLSISIAHVVQPIVNPSLVFAFR